MLCWTLPHIEDINIDGIAIYSTRSAWKSLTSDGKGQRSTDDKHVEVTLMKWEVVDSLRIILKV